MQENSAVSFSSGLVKVFRKITVQKFIAFVKKVTTKGNANILDLEKKLISLGYGYWPDVYTPLV